MPLLLNIGIKDVAREFNFDQSNARAAMAAIKAFVIELLLSGGVSVLIRRPSRTREQEKLYHKLISEVSKQVRVFGKTYEPEIWKALLVDQFEQERLAMNKPLRKPGQIVPAMDGSGRMVTVRPSTTGFSVEEGSEFIEFTYAQGVEMGVKWPASAEEIAANEREWIATNRRTAA